MVNVFTREITDNLASLVKKIEKIVADNSEKKMAAFVVHLTDDLDASEATLKKLAKTQKLKENA